MTSSVREGREKKKRRNSQVGVANKGPEGDSQDGTITLVCTIAALGVYAVLNALSQLLPRDGPAISALHAQVPLVLYQMSATAFFTALVLNLTSFLFEDSGAKRQLALLSCTIKGAACYTDILMITGKATVMWDAHGVMLVPIRYVQWSITTPLMVFILSKISDFTPARTMKAVAADVIMVATGFAAHVTPAPYHWAAFLISMLLFIYVMHEMGEMVFSAIRAEMASASPTSLTSKRSLIFIYICTLVIWSLFPVCWVLGYFRPTALLHNEVLVLFANFTAKVLFSSSIMYSNYMTISQRRMAAQAAAENQQRIAMVSDLKEAVTRKDAFMSLMSHELRTPLNGIIQLSDALCRGSGGEMNPKGQQFMRTIKNSSNHLLNIINDILDVAALKEGKLTVKHEVVSLAKAVEHVVEIVSPLAKKEVSIVRKIDPRTPLVIGDFSRMVQILYNLLGNSLKFTQSGHVGVYVAPADAQGTKVIVRVEDTGIGIPKAKIPAIWGAFEQVDMSVTRKYGGTGLGLNIVKQLVSAHDGTIVCESEEGRGTAFTITLPVMQRNTRASLEMQVRQSCDTLGLAGPSRTDNEDTVTRLSSNTSIGKLGGPGSQSLLRRSLQLMTGTSPPASPALTSQTQRAASASQQQPHGPTAASVAAGAAAAAFGTSRVSHAGGNTSDEEGRERLIKRRTYELERDAMMSDLSRRTELKKSIDEQAMQRQSMSGAATPSAAKPVTAGAVSFAAGTNPGSSSGASTGVGAGAAAAAASSGQHGPSSGTATTTKPPLPTPTANGTAQQPAAAGSGSRPGAPSAGLVPLSAAQGGSAGVRPALTIPHATSPDGGRSLLGMPVNGLGSPMSRYKPGAMGNPLFRGGNAAHRKNNSGGWGESTDEDTASGNESDEEDDPEEDLRSLRNQSCRLPTLRPGTSGGALASLALARNGGGANGARLSTNGVVPGRGQSFSGPAGNPSRMMHQSLINRPTASVVEDSDSDQQAPSAQRRGASTLIGRGQTRGQLALNGPGVHRTKSNGNQLSTVAAGLSLEKLAHSSMYGSVQILSVDDEEVNQIVLEEILTSTGYQYARAMDGVEALEWLLAQDTLPDLILLDCMMPNMSGHEFCSMLRQYIPGSVLPVIMVSAKSDEDNIVEGLRSGSNDFVRKPYQREELLARIEAQLRLKNDSWWLAELVNNQDGRETQSMKLLKNILPESIIARMQSGQKFVADSHQHVVILFSDIVGFTNLSSKLPTAEVFLMLSNMFNAFDKLTDRFAVYKVETIGDAYMVAAGHDEDEAKARKGTPTERVVAMAKAMIDVVGNITAPNGERLRIRIGVHCGPAFAGVIGSKCPRYCFLGDTVNTASRMESLSFPMCVQVSSDMAAHWDQASDQLVTLGERDVKGKGRMTTFLLKYGDWEEAVKMWRETSSMREQAAVGGGPDRQVSNVTQSSAHQGTGRNSLESMASVLIHQQSLVGNGPPASHGDAAANGHAGMLAMPFRSHLYSNNAGYDSPIITSPPATAASSFSPAALQDKLNQLAAQLAAEQQAVKAAREEADRERLKASEVAARLRSALQQLASAPTGSGSNGPAPGTQQQQGGGGGGGGGSPDRDRNITLQQGISVGAGAVALVPAPSGIFEPDRASGALSLTFQQVDTTTSPERGAGNLPAPTFSAASSALPGGSGLLIRLAKASSTYGLAVPPVNIARLFAELGLESYLGRFEQEAIKLDMLLTMDQSQLDALGLRPLGYCMRVREAVVDLAKALLRMCEDRAALGN